MRAEGRARMRSGRRRAARRAPGRGWAAARAVDVFGGCRGGAALGGDRAEGGGLDPEVGRRWSERAGSGARAGSQRGSPGSPVMEPRGACPGASGVGRGSGVAAGERRLRLGWACEGASACVGVPRVDPTPPALRPCRGRLPPGGAGRGTLPVPEEACPARPGELGSGEPRISRPPKALLSPAERP